MSEGLKFTPQTETEQNVEVLADEVKDLAQNIGDLQNLLVIAKTSGISALKRIFGD